MTTNKNKKNNKKNKKDCIVFINIGSYCDGTLSYAIAETLSEKYNVKFATDKTSVIKNSSITPTVIFDSPTFMTSDPMIGAADTSSNLSSWVLTKPHQAIQYYNFVKTINGIISDLNNKFKPICILFHYSLVNVALNLDHDKLASKGMNKQMPAIGIIYYSPAIINSTIPWLFDGNLRDKSFELYGGKKNEKRVDQSWENIRSRTIYLSLLLKTKLTETIFLQRLNSMHHILCWDKNMTKNIKHKIDQKAIHYAGAVYPDFTIEKLSIEKDKNMNSSLKTFIIKQKERNIPIALVSFGSFAKFPQLRAAINEIVPILSKTHAVILHKTWNANDDDSNEKIKKAFDNERIFVQVGFVSYATLIPHIKLIMFTGSLCLQFIALKTSTKMIFTPLITEQFFWAKNYEHFTGTPYIDVALVYEHPVSKQMNDALTYISTMTKKPYDENRIKMYLKKVEENMKKDMQNKTPGIIQAVQDTIDA